MRGNQNRYFIELEPDEGETPPRWRETEIRRALAARFVELISEWLQEEELEDKVSALAITALGQVQITCESDVIQHIRQQDIMSIVAIRQGVMFAEQTQRWNEAR